MDENIDMNPGDYRVQIHILQAQDLIPRGGFSNFLFGAKGDSADPMVQVELMGEKRYSKVKKGTLAPIFNETLFFSLPGLTTE